MINKGNVEILNLHKTAFLCSQKYPAEIILKSYDWAIEQLKQGILNHSQIEKKTLHELRPYHSSIIIFLTWF